MLIVSTMLELWGAITLSECFGSLSFLDHSLSAFDELQCMNWSLVGLFQFWSNFSYMLSHGLSLISFNLMVYILEATRNWHVQHWIYDFRCRIASFKCKSNFLTKGCNRSSKISIWLLDYYISYQHLGQFEHNLHSHVFDDIITNNTKFWIVFIIRVKPVVAEMLTLTGVLLGQK